ncbi:hypothetical protein G9A89_005688 [Geosiphon pyriformis]|nr:hypothetical protein G9A89_005688 [Geosiphon pyriformis]
MPSSIPIDTFLIVLDYLDDLPGILFNCLLINRLCCRFIIPRLWRKPFNLIVPGFWSQANPKKSAILISVLISCLSQKSQIPFKYHFPYNIFSSKSLFEYTNYIRIFNQRSALKTIAAWQEQTLEYRFYRFWRRVLFSVFPGLKFYFNYSEKGRAAVMLFQVLLGNCENLDELIVSKTTMDDSINLFVDEFRLGFKLPQNIRRIHLDTAGNFYPNFYDRQASNLATVIVSQNKLEEFCISDFSSGWDILFVALGHQIKSLKRLKFYRCNFGQPNRDNTLSLFSQMSLLFFKDCCMDEQLLYELKEEMEMKKELSSITFYQKFMKKTAM